MGFLHIIKGRGGELELRLTKEISVEEWIKASKEEGVAFGKLPDDVKEQMKKNFPDGKGGIGLHQVTVLDSEELIERFRKLSVYMFYQLIETTPRTKNSIIKTYEQNKEIIIKDLDESPKVAWLDDIRRKTPEEELPDTDAVHAIIRLALSETNSYRYRNLLIDSMPYIKKWVTAQRNMLKRKENHISDMIELATEGPSEEMIRMKEKHGVDIDDETLFEMVRKKATRELREAANMHQNEATFDIEHIQKDTRNIGNIHDQKRTLQLHDEEPITYTVKDLYIVGAIYFIDEFLEMLPESSFTFNSRTELSVYAKVADRINVLYASKKWHKRIKRSKTKDRPIPIRNNETFGHIIDFYMDDKEGERLAHYLSHLYTHLDARGDLLWNTILDKTDLDRVTQIMKEWNEEYTEGPYVIPDENREQYYLMSILITALEKQQIESNKFLKETIVRLDEQREKELMQHIGKKDRRINTLKDKIEQKNQALSRIDFYKEQAEGLEEKVKWLEELVTQEEIIEDTFEEEPKEITIEETIDLLRNSNTCVLGGNINWQQGLKKDLPDISYIRPDDLGRSMSAVEKADIIIYNSATMNHGMFYKFRNSMKRNNNDPIVIYINNQASNIRNTYVKIGKHLMN